MRYEIIELTTRNPHRCLAIEEHLFDTLPEGCSRLILYVNSPCVVFGKHQVAWKEANIRYLAENEIIAARRISGGGTVFHDHGNLNYSFLTEKDLYRRGDVLSFVSQGLNTLGITAFISDDLDIVTSDGKISGNAFCFRRGRALHHGTVLVSADLGRMSAALKGLDDSITTRAVDSRKTKVANAGVIAPDIDVDLVAGALIDAFVGAFVKEGDCSTRIAYEDGGDSAIDALETRNESWDWIFGRSPDFTISCGTYRDAALELHVKKGIVVSAPGFESIGAELIEEIVGQRLRAQVLGGVLDRISETNHLEMIPLINYLA